MDEISGIINRAMKKKGITQKTLAEFLGVSQPSVNKWISGKGFPTADKFIEIVKHLDLVSDFFPGYKKIDTKEEQENASLKNRMTVMEKKMEGISRGLDKLVSIVSEKVSPEEIIDAIWDES